MIVIWGGRKVNQNEKKINVLFVHNSIPEYRIEFWRQLGNEINLDILVTRTGLEEKIYGLEKNVTGLNITPYTTSINLEGLVEKYDIIILPPVDSILEYKVALRLKFIAKSKKKKYIYWTEKWVPDIKLQPLKKRIKNVIQGLLIKSVAQGADYCIAAGSKSAEYYDLLGINKDKVRIAYDSSTSPELKEHIDIREKYKIGEKKIILYFGRIVERKGPDVLIEACKDILKKNNSVLLMCGEGEYIDECKMMAKGYPIIFAGKIQPAIRRAFYQQSDVFVLPSYCKDGNCEAWGLTVNEAIECGTPVISTTAVGAAYDILENSREAGMMVKEKDIKILRNAIETVLDGTMKYNRNTIKKYYQKFSIREMSDSFLKIFNETQCKSKI